MNPPRIVSIAALGAICGLSCLGIAPRVLSQTDVDRELAILADFSNLDFGDVKSAHTSVFGSGSFFADYVAPLPLKQIAVNFFAYADGVRDVGWTLIKSEQDAVDFGNAISLFNPNLGTGFTNLGTAISDATTSINSNVYDGQYNIFDLASNGEDLDFNGLDAIDESKKALNQGIDAINSISTQQVAGSPLTVIINLPGNKNNPVGQPAFSLNNLSFSPDTYTAALKTKFQRELIGTSLNPPTSIPEPSAAWAIIGLSLFPLARKRNPKNID